MNELKHTLFTVTLKIFQLFQLDLRIMLFNYYFFSFFFYCIIFFNLFLNFEVQLLL